jgi:threonine dehydrogenase-like Zn-dependent dehydrogenase
MRATVMYGAGDVRVEDVPDARLVEATDALVVVSRACICGSDLWPYRTMEPSEARRPMGHEAIGVVDAVGAEVGTVKPGDLVVMPFAYSDGSCVFCREGLSRRPASTAGSSATPRSAGRRPRRSVSPKRTGPLSPCRSARTTRCCRRSSPFPT